MPVEVAQTQLMVCLGVTLLGADAYSNPQHYHNLGSSDAQSSRSHRMLGWLQRSLDLRIF